MTSEEYRKIEGEDEITSESQFASKIDKLIGQPVDGYLYNAKNGATFLLRHILSGTYGYNHGRYDGDYGLLRDELAPLVKSKSVSDAYKESLRLEFKDNEEYKKYLVVFDQDKDINDMSEDELVCINRLVNASKDGYLRWSMRDYLFRLDGEGVISFIKNNMDSMDIVEHILESTNINSRASYYSGRGVNFGDLNYGELTTIFKKLFKLDPEYAKEFVNMVLSMQTLGATEFITNFFRFANNGFKMDGLEISDTNVSLDGLHDEARDLVAFISVHSVIGRDAHSQKYLSSRMKSCFLSNIKYILEKYIPDFDYEKVKAECLDYREGYEKPGVRRRASHDNDYYMW